MKSSSRRSLFGFALLFPLTYSAAAGWQDLLESVLTSPETQTAVQSSGLSEADIGAGLREALAIGAERAVAILGRSNGYLGDPTVHIPLPGTLRSAAKGLKLIGQEQLARDFEQTLNRAAEQAIPRTLSIVKETVRDMSLQDVRGILEGGDDSATQFLRDKAGERLHTAVRPIVSEATDSTGATAAYKRLARELDSSLGGLVDTRSVDLDDYVTRKALEGLFLKLAAEEKAIRHDPVARSTALLKKVFGS